jgi:hypothetical protein
VYEIFKSDSVDPGVKKSAVDQLAIILHGKLPVSHKNFESDKKNKTLQIVAQ